MYKTIIFDAGSTLIDARLNREGRFLHFAGEWRLGLEPEAARSAHQQVFQVHFGQGFRNTTTQAQEDAMWTAFYGDVLATLHLEDPDEALARRLVSACDWKGWMYVHDGVPGVLAQLQGRFRLGLLSNAPPTLRQVMHHLGLAGYFEHMVISGEVGLRKPEPGIYALALQSLGVSAPESLFVDDMEENLAAAQQIGMDVLLIDYKNSQPETGLRRITSLEGGLTCV